MAGLTRQLSSSVQEKDKNIIELKSREQELLKKYREFNARAKSFELRMAALQAEKAELEKQLKNMQGEEQIWQVKEEGLTGQIRESEQKLKDIWEMHDELLRKNKLLNDENNNLKDKVED